jgi:hypothetical protein
VRHKQSELTTNCVYSILLHGIYCLACRSSYISHLLITLLLQMLTHIVSDVVFQFCFPKSLPLSERVTGVSKNVPPGGSGY